MANLSTLVPAPRILTPSPPNAGDQNNTFIDSSSNRFTITRNGNTTQGTFSPYGDNWSNYFDGTGDYLSITGQSLASGDWTIECWVYFQSFTNAGPHIFDFGTDSTNRYVLWRNDSSGKFEFVTVNNNTLDFKPGTTSPVVGTWYHVAVVRSSGTTKLYVNGTSEATSTTAIDGGTNWRIGHTISGNAANTYYLLGYISNFRVVTSAVYTANFTPPTAPLTAITNTSLLTCSTNRFRDVSSNNFTITRNGDVSVQRFSPFSPTAAYAAGTIGGSGYFDGTGDYLQLTGGDGFNLTGDFTVEAWIYRTTTGSQRIVGKWNLAGNLAWVLETSTTAIGFGVANSGTFSASLSFNATINLFAWNHVAVSRSGSTVRAFLNGVDLGSATSSANCTANNTNPIQIGQTENVNYVNGYVCDVRVLKGTAQYTAAFTPPTAPLTAITNTSLLLNFTNAGIRDDAMMTVLETVGDSQIDTAIKKYGTGSMEFDAIGDRLVTPSSPDNAFGTGNFTIEFWVYRTGGGQRAFISTRTTSTTGWSVSTDGSNRVLFNYDSSFFSTSSTLANNTWYHIAVVREGTGTNQTKIYINGTSSATGTVASDFTPSGIAIAVNRSSTDASAGYFDEIRLTKGVARYTTNFTPPQTSLPVDKDTVLLLDGDGTPNSNIQVDTYTTTGTVHTWTKPAGAKAVMINIRGAGGGGGGGQGGAATSTRLGGGGGGGGARVEQICTADCLPNTLYVIVGAGGAGGAGGNAAIGSAGGAGGNSYVAKNNTNPPVTGIVAFAGGGGGGSGGFQNSNCGGGGGGGSSGQGATSTGNTSAAGGWPGYSIASGEANGGSGGPGPFSDSYRGVVEWGGGAGGSNQAGGQNTNDRRGQHSLYGSGGGGPGVSIASNQVVQTTGGIGGNSGFADYTTVGAQPGTNGTNGSAGSAGASYLVTGNGGGGGGGGGVATATGGTGGTGGAGGLGGGGGGGGGGAGGGNTNGIGGTGGAGGNGVVEIITYF